MCQSVYSIALIPDGWTPPHAKVEFLGIGGLCINSTFDKTLVILGLGEMNEGHTAEKTKETMETIINNFDFDKRKIRGNILNFII